MKRIFYWQLGVLLILTGWMAANPSTQRIVSLVPSLTESLFDLGVGSRLVGVTSYCLRPAAALQIERVGSVVSFSCERIVALRPDLVLAIGMAEQRGLASLSKLGIAVHTFHSPRSYAEICTQFRRLGELTSRQEAAKNILQTSDAQLAAIGQAVRGLPSKKVFIQLGSKPLFAATRDSYTHDYIVYAGGINIAAASPSGLYSREAVIAADPDLIIIVSMGMQTQTEKAQWLDFTGMKAVKNQAIHVVDAVRYCVPTPAGFIEALKQTVGFIHPQVKRQ